MLVVALVALCYCGGKYCPSILRQNKEMLLGVVVGMALCSFMDMRVEGYGDAAMDAWNDAAERQAAHQAAAARAPLPPLPPLGGGH